MKCRCRQLCNRFLVVFTILVIHCFHLGCTRGVHNEPINNHIYSLQTNREGHIDTIINLFESNIFSMGYDLHNKKIDNNVIVTNYILPDHSEVCVEKIGNAVRFYIKPLRGEGKGKEIEKFRIKLKTWLIAQQEALLNLGKD